MIHTILTIVMAIVAARASEHAPTPPADALALAKAVADAPADMRPLLLAVAWVESRMTPAALGDGGRSCGAWQQQARYSPGYSGSYWARPPKMVCGAVVVDDAAKECTRLRSDARYAGCIARHQLGRMSPAEYNAGRRGARLGRGDAYAARVAAAQRRFQ
jgi:hypothetical protein